MSLSATALAPPPNLLCNPVVDPGAPNSIGGLNTIAALADRLNIPLRLQPSKSPIYHFFGRKGNSSPGAWTVATWMMPVLFQSGTRITLPVECVPGDDPILVGLDFLDHCILDNPKNRIILERDGKQHIISTFKHSDGHRYIEIAPRNEGQQHYSFLSGQWKTIQDKKDLINLLHQRTHGSSASIKMLMERNGLWTRGLKQHLESVCKNCATCVQTGLPLPARKVSLSHIAGQFNESIGVDFFYWNRTQADTVLCIHAMCMGTGYSEAEPCLTRDMTLAAERFEAIWIYNHGRPVNCAFDPEFNKSPFLEMLSKHGVIPKPRPARRHNKMGRVERKHRTIKLILSRLVLDHPTASNWWLIKFGVFLSNVLGGDKLATSFEQVRGYTPGLFATPMMKTPTDVLEAHKNLVAHRALHQVLKTKAVAPIAHKVLTPGTHIYGYVETKKGHAIWKPYKVLSCDGHKVEVRAASRGPKTLLAIEDVRLRPDDSLAREVIEGEMNVQNIEYDAQELEEEGFPEVPFTEIWPDDENADDQQSVQENQLSSPTAELEKSTHPPSSRSAAADSTHSHTPSKDDLIEQREATQTEVQTSEQAPPEPQPLRRSIRERRPNVKLSPDEYSLLSTDPQLLDGSTLRSLEQSLLAKVHRLHGHEQFTRAKGPDVPTWLYDNALATELDNWQGAIEQCDVSSISPGSNIVGCHVVYKVKREDDGTFTFKARLVLHGNEDASKDDIRKDSATAHLSTIRLILSLAVIYRFKLAKIDIKAAYFQSGPIRRRIFVRPPRDLLLHRSAWRLLRLPYGIAEAGRQWQLTSDDFMHSIGMEEVYALPQCFMLK